MGLGSKLQKVRTHLTIGSYEALFFDLVTYPLSFFVSWETKRRWYSTKNRLREDHLRSYIEREYGIRFPRLDGSYTLGGVILVYIEGIYDFFPISDDDVVYDVGASGGDYALKCARRGARVVSFEMEDAAFESLEENIRANSMEDDVTAFNCAVGRENSIDSFVEETGKAPTVIKISAEDAEASILEGAEKALEEASRVIVETYTPQSRKECLTILKEHGYVITKDVEVTSEISRLFLEREEE